MKRTQTSKNPSELLTMLDRRQLAETAGLSLKGDTLAKITLTT